MPNILDFVLENSLWKLFSYSIYLIYLISKHPYTLEMYSLFAKIRNSNYRMNHFHKILYKPAASCLFPPAKLAPGRVTRVILFGCWSVERVKIWSLLTNTWLFFMDNERRCCQEDFLCWHLMCDRSSGSVAVMWSLKIDCVCACVCV